MNPDPVSVRPVGYVSSPRLEPNDEPWAEVVSTIQLSPDFTPESLLGLEEFSHVEIVFLFHQVAEEEAVGPDARHPRGNSDWPKVGIFSQRDKSRPNRLGVSVAKLVKCEGTTLTLRGLDAIDGTPVLDIKPVLQQFLPRGEVSQPAWSTELMARYWE